MAILDLLPVPRIRNGSVLALSKLYFYANHTTTPQTTYNNADGDPSHENTNPLIADADGLFGPVFLQALTYTVVLKTAAGVTVYSQDDVAGPHFDPGVNIVAHTINLEGDQSLYEPDAGPIYCSMEVSATSAHSGVGEVLMNLDFIANTGSADAAGARYKVGFSSAILGQPGVGDIWAATFVSTIQSGCGATSRHIGVEIDINNNNQNDAAFGKSGGLLFSSSSTFYSSAAITVSGALNAWYRGICFDSANGGCVVNAAIEDNTSAVQSYLMAGTHTYGINAQDGVFSTSVLAMPNNKGIQAKDSGATLRNVVKLNASDYVELGFSGGGIQFGTHTGIGAETVSGFITIKDIGGTTRKLAVVS